MLRRGKIWEGGEGINIKLLLTCLLSANKNVSTNLRELRYLWTTLPVDV